MKITYRTVVSSLVFAFACVAVEGRVQAAEADDVNWPSFRGHHAAGVAEGFELPVQWSVADKQNIRWQVPVPGLGHSCPVIWGDRIFLTTAVRDTGRAELKPGLYGDIEPVKDLPVHRWVVYCFDKATGKILWDRPAHTGVPRIKRHPKSSHANPTPATDGKHVVAFFGPEGIYCYDLEGNLIWEEDLGLLDAGFYRVPSAQWGFASSPVIHDDFVIVQCDVQKDSFIAALSIEDGSEVWRTPRNDVPTWSTPTIFVHAGRTQIIANGYKHMGGYAAADGKELWRMSGGGDIPVATPIVGRDLIYLTSAHGRPAPIYAVRATAAGNITLADGQSANEHVAWSYPKGGNYMPTPILYGEHLYLGSDRSVLSCLNAETGEYLYQEKLGVGPSFTASPVAGDGKIYLTAESGKVVVVKAGPQFQTLAVNDLGENCLATPAISEGVLFFRTQHHLVAVAEE
jgi:outer membrane protein assembly factor BamB